MINNSYSFFYIAKLYTKYKVCQPCYLFLQEILKHVLDDVELFLQQVVAATTNNGKKQKKKNNKKKANTNGSVMLTKPESHWLILIFNRINSNHLMLCHFLQLKICPIGRNLCLVCRKLSMDSIFWCVTLSLVHLSQNMKMHYPMQI